MYLTQCVFLFRPRSSPLSAIAARPSWRPSLRCHGIQRADPAILACWARFAPWSGLRCVDRSVPGLRWPCAKRQGRHASPLRFARCGHRLLGIAPAASMSGSPRGGGQAVRAPACDCPGPAPPGPAPPRAQAPVPAPPRATPVRRGGVKPKCRHAAGVAMRPRLVRSR